MVQNEWGVLVQSSGCVLQGKARQLGQQTGKEVKGEDRGFQETSGQACFELGMVTVMDSHAWSWS